MDLCILAFSFFMIATLYSSAGFGGGSSYLAILALFNFNFIDVRMLALICNIIVVSNSFFVYYKNDLLKFSKIIPLVLLSVPLAFLGGQIPLKEDMFFIILGLSLSLAALLMFFSNTNYRRQLPKYSNAFVGGAIGFLSGMVGIGGGIFLSPVLHLSHWDKTKIIAATTATFILVNSISGLLSQTLAHGFSVPIFEVFILGVCVFVGGQLGSRISIEKLNPNSVKKLTAILIFLVGMRLLYTYLF